MWSWGKMYTLWTSSVTPLVVLDKMKIIEPNNLSLNFPTPPVFSLNIKSVMKLVWIYHI